MILYENTIKNFRLALSKRQLGNFIAEEYYSRTARKLSPIEKVTLKYTLEVLKQLIVQGRVNCECGIRIDYVMQQGNSNIEVIIAGKSSDDELVHIIELLPWERVRSTDEEDLVSCDYSDRSDHYCVHPAYQSVAYRKFFSDSARGTDVESYVYLFECPKTKEAEQILDFAKYRILHEAAVYFAEEDMNISRRLYQFKDYKQGKEMLEAFHERDQLSSEGIDAFLSGILDKKSLDILTDGQRMVIASTIKQCREKNNSVLLVEGAPGTGKTMMAIACMQKLQKANMHYLTPTKAQQEQLMHRGRVHGISTVQKFIDQQKIHPEKYNVLFLDESHRLFSGLSNSSDDIENLDLILNSASVVVCLYNRTQYFNGMNPEIVQIQKYVESRGKSFHTFALDQNVRFSGSGSGINWLTHQFQIADTGNYEDWDSDIFEIDVVDTPDELFERIRKKNNNGLRSRVLIRDSRYLPVDSDTGVKTFSIPEYKYKAPVYTENNIQGANWFTDDSLADHVADIYAVQGMEFSYVGIIIDDELRYDERTDKILVSEGEDQLIKQAYYVLMTRGMKGVYLFIRDQRLKDYIKDRIHYSSRRFMWIKELTQQYDLDSGERLFSDGYKLEYAYVTKSYKDMNRVIGTLKNNRDEELDEDEHKQLTDQVSRLLLESQNIPLSHTDIADKYEKLIVNNLGKAAWDKLSSEGKKCLLSAELTYHDMKDYNQLYDFSPVCVQASKTVELEMTTRYFKEYLSFLEEHYGFERSSAEFLNAIPSVLKKTSRGTVRLLKEHEITLGSVQYIVGIETRGRIRDQEAYQMFSLYARKRLFHGTVSGNRGCNIQNVLTKHIRYIGRIKDDYRNKAAHKESMDVVSAKACLDYIVEVQRTLGKMLDEYKF